MHPLLIFADTALEYYQSTKLEIQENVPGLIGDLSTEVQILFNIINNSKFFLLLKTAPGKILNEYSLKISFEKNPLANINNYVLLFMHADAIRWYKKSTCQMSWIILFID